MLEEGIYEVHIFRSMRSKISNFGSMENMEC